MIFNISLKSDCTSKILAPAYSSDVSGSLSPFPVITQVTTLFEKSIWSPDNFNNPATAAAEAGSQ